MNENESCREGNDEAEGGKEEFGVCRNGKKGRTLWSWSFNLTKKCHLILRHFFLKYNNNNVPL